MDPLFSSTIKVNCPDGPRYILKHSEKAFAITFPDWDVRVKTLVKFYSGSEAKVDPVIFRRVKSIVENLTENYAALQSHYQTAYLGWWGNPCGKEAERAYNDAKAMICEKEFALKELESKTLKIANQIKTQLRTKRITKKKKAKAKARVRREAERIPYTPSAEGRIPVPETVFENIQELVSKLKI